MAIKIKRVKGYCRMQQFIEVNLRHPEEILNKLLHSGQGNTAIKGYFALGSLSALNSPVTFTPFIALNALYALIDL